MKKKCQQFSWLSPRIVFFSSFLFHLVGIQYLCFYNFLNLTVLQFQGTVLDCGPCSIAWCVVNGVLIYSHLASFFWMFIEGESVSQRVQNRRFVSFFPLLYSEVFFLRTRAPTHLPSPHPPTHTLFSPYIFPSSPRSQRPLEQVPPYLHSSLPPLTPPGMEKEKEGRKGDQVASSSFTPPVSPPPAPPRARKGKGGRFKFENLALWRGG